MQAIFVEIFSLLPNKVKPNNLQLLEQNKIIKDCVVLTTLATILDMKFAHGVTRRLAHVTRTVVVLAIAGTHGATVIAVTVRHTRVGTLAPRCQPVQ